MRFHSHINGSGFFHPSLMRVAGVAILILSASAMKAAESDERNRSADDLAEATAFFETSVRPVLVEKCSQCHSRAANKTKGGLSLDSIGDLTSGGESGPAIVPGNPKDSLLIRLISHPDDTQKMPPKGRLTDRQIANLIAWVRTGAPWPGSRAGTPPKPAAGMNLRERMANHWAWHPVAPVQPPLVRDVSWARNDIDRFVLAKLEEKRLQPAAEADRRTLIRRLTFDLTGLPPTSQEVEAFLSDSSPDAHERLVERLLASPRFGERWARHWLDVVRFAETAGQEHDDPIAHAWRYRDYVIRALNADVPYDQFVREQVAGDLITSPRFHATEGTNESILGTAFWFLGEATRAPTDVRYDQFTRTDNQIDTLGKAFLGLPLGCAQCHDHKFDPIPQADYYALWGFAESTRRQEALLDPRGQIAVAAKRAAAVYSQSNRTFVQAMSDATGGLWKQLLDDERQLPNDLSEASAGSEHVADFRSAQSFDGWYTTGVAFGDGPARSGQWDTTMAPLMVPLPAGAAHSGLLGDRFAGVLRSRTFTLTKPTLLYRLAGRNAKVRLIIDGYTQDVFDPLLFKGATFDVNDAQMHWHRQAQDVSRYIGHRAHIELIDDGDGWFAVEQILLADADALPPADADRPLQVVRWLSERRLLNTGAAADQLSVLAGQINTIAALAPTPVRVLAAVDGDGWDERVLLRGNVMTPGPVAPRRFLQALSPATQSPVGAHTSGRLELAARMTDLVANPLLSRVMVNRIWHHLFGRGIVASTDNFGFLGERPTHPELLDHLAGQFVTDGWSIKRTIQSIVLSSTYRMSARAADPEAAATIDPGNELLHSSRVRRLQAEAVRDALYAVAGELDEMGDNALTDTASGEYRRSIYLAVKRNAPDPLLKAFDAPWPYYAIGRRDVSNVPAQALILMNDPRIHEIANRWAERTLARTPDATTAARIARMYEEAFCRPPTQGELAAIESFFTEHAEDLGIPPAERHSSTRLWGELAHAMMNAKDFIFIN